jgi:hypothetical protein
MLTEEIRDEKTVSVALGPPQPPLGTKIIPNVMFGGLRYVFVAPIPFGMTRLILHNIGVAGHGTWAVLLAINGMRSLAELGLVGTLSKFVAEYLALARLLNSGLTLFLLLDFGIGTTLWGGNPFPAGFRRVTTSITRFRRFVRWLLGVVRCETTGGRDRKDFARIGGNFGPCWC